MKLDQKTITILKNFATINQSIWVNEGSELSTISLSKTLYAKAHVKEIFSKAFGIYDLSRFLGVLSLFNQPDLEFTDTHILIKEGARKVKYIYAAQNMIVTPPNKQIKIENPEINFEITSEQLTSLLKALHVLQLPEIVIAGSNGKISLQAANTKDSSGDNFQLELCDTDQEFYIVFKVENLLMLSGNYHVEISSRPISRFSTDGLEYFVAIEKNSRFGN